MVCINLFHINKVSYKHVYNIIRNHREILIVLVVDM